jgi:anti-sigma B factor antagonist
MASIHTEMHSNTCVVHVSGDLDVSGTGQVRSDLLHSVAEADGPVVFELGQVEYLGSMGLALLAEGAQSVKRAGRGVAFCSLQDTARQVFRMTRLEQVYKVYATVDQALGALADQGGV